MIGTFAPTINMYDVWILNGRMKGNWKTDDNSQDQQSTTFTWRQPFLVFRFSNDMLTAIICKVNLKLCSTKDKVELKKSMATGCFCCECLNKWIIWECMALIHDCRVQYNHDQCKIVPFNSSFPFTLTLDAFGSTGTRSHFVNRFLWRVIYLSSIYIKSMMLTSNFHIQIFMHSLVWFSHHSKYGY